MLEATYLHNSICKPDWLSVRVTALRLQELNSYLKDLPSKHAGEPMNKPLARSELCAILLRMVPNKWESNFWVATDNVVSIDLSKLVDKLEQIEKAYSIGVNPKEVSFPKPKPMKSMKSMKSWVAKGKPPTQKLGRTRRVGLPTKMFCIHCKAQKGRYWTQNTPDCHIGYSKQDQTKLVKDAYAQFKELQDKRYSKIKNVIKLLWAKNRKEDMEFSHSDESM